MIEPAAESPDLRALPARCRPDRRRWNPQILRACSVGRHPLLRPEDGDPPDQRRDAVRAPEGTRSRGHRDPGGHARHSRADRPTGSPNAAWTCPRSWTSWVSGPSAGPTHRPPRPGRFLTRWPTPFNSGRSGTPMAARRAWNGRAPRSGSSTGCCSTRRRSGSTSRSTTRPARLVAQGRDLAAEGATPISRLTVDEGRFERENIWPTEADLGTVVILPGRRSRDPRSAWWHADDERSWRWSIELSNSLD